ncbi:hypothetical protein NMG60_11003095 [Bertholletia excelsa]
MNALVRSTTLHIRRRSDGYEPLDGRTELAGEGSLGRKSFSSTKGGQNCDTASSLSYRRERAKQRQIFLRTYKLESSVSYAGKSGKSTSKNPNRAVVKVKSVVVSAVSFMWFSSFRSCACGSVTGSNSSPTRVGIRC